MNSKQLLARKDATGAVQTLRDHLHDAGKLARDFEEEFSAISYTAALLHDLGKASEDFQEYLLSAKGHRGSVIHAWQGAFLIDDACALSSEKSAAEQAVQEITREILELAIAKHHGELPDCLDVDGLSTFFDGLATDRKNEIRFSYQEVKDRISYLDLDIAGNYDKSIRDVEHFMQKFNMGGIANSDSFYFYLGLFAKYVYSRLIDADRLDAACFEERRTYRSKSIDWSSLIDRFEKNIRKFDHTSEINKIRNQISEQCRLEGKRSTGIYRLAVPTGGGKTLASLNFALHHAIETNKRRIIYVIPYLSITSQTVKVFREILELDEDDTETLLEHYSSAGGRKDDDTFTNTQSEFDQEEDDEQNAKRKLATERWDSQIIVTTMVRFLETVMSSKSGDLRRFHNMADSIIIFDEIQSLPTNAINLFNEVVSFLSKILGSTIVLCSATQPLLERTSRKNLLLADCPNLIDDSQEYFEKLRRTCVVAATEMKNCDELAEIIYEKAKENGNCLAIVNLKSEARIIYQCLKTLNGDNHFKIIHLSTSMCGQHRTDKLELVRQLTSIDKGKPVICISTQLIEAGVDVSFSCVIRAMAGLDSILQAAGRCNRNGESKSPKKVYVFGIKDEKGLSYLPDIKMGKEITERMVREHPDEDLLSNEMLLEYYQLFFEGIQSGNDNGFGIMDYPIPGKQNLYAYDLLSCNRAARGQYVNSSGTQYLKVYAQAFKTVGNRFRVIPNQNHNVVVHYGRVEKHMERLSRGNLREQFAALRQLQDYSVSLFDNEYRSLDKRGAITLENEDFGIYMLNKDYYKEEYGVVTETEMSLLYI
ncbi:CRISPR-associated helicase Cas3' [Bifidobacterium dentium]|uniref:CRISPR-associated helicase Cas3' n=1 Tax=Bifidobacterium dentium TaxID=1689 RepID=UPI0018C2E91D|nr:CRISPR-associated helicase Cas3' [Bifidobacterium dentium]MBF9708841.1 CRISPR-associated helicase Cas3' [Bifidobacterium dentium]